MWNDPYSDPPDSTYHEEEEHHEETPSPEYGGEGSMYGDTTDYSEAKVPDYDVNDARWESQFESSQMVKVTRSRLSRLQQAMVLDKILAGTGSRAVAFVIDFLITAVLIYGPFYLETKDYLDKYLPPDIDTRTLILLGHALLALFYYRLTFTLFGGRTFGRVVAGIRIVDGRGPYLKFVQAFIYVLLQTISYIPPLFLINGIIAMTRADKRSLIDLMLNSREVQDEAWFKLAQKSIYRDDVSKLGQ